MKKLRTLVVVHASLVPPDTLEGYSDKQVEEWRTEYDVASTLRASGHEVRCSGVLDSLTDLRSAIADWRPDIVFNLLEEFDGIVTYDQHVVAFLELLRQPYTGCNPRGLLLSRDKFLCKQLLAFHRIPTPLFTVFRKGARFHVPRKLKYPLFVKSTVEDASLGIAQASVVDTDERLVERVEFIHRTLNSHAIAEQYIDGREIYVSVIGHRQLQTYTPWELDMEKWPEGVPKIATSRVKWNAAYQDKIGLVTKPAVLSEDQQKNDEMLGRLQRLSKRIYRILGLSGYARLDYRVTADGRMFLLEANPNPQIARGEDFADSAAHCGISYERLLQKIVSLGLSYDPLVY
jgi:D-alanine-D-alanine ligase